MNSTVTNHYKNKRYKRENFINKYIHNDGSVIDSFVVNRNHPSGEELHQITDNGIIIISNLESGALVTKLIARENQIKRYYEDSNKTPPKEYKRVLELARWHESLGYNQV